LGAGGGGISSRSKRDSRKRRKKAGLGLWPGKGTLNGKKKGSPHSMAGIVHPRLLQGIVTGPRARGTRWERKESSLHLRKKDPRPVMGKNENDDLPEMGNGWRATS